MPLLGDPGHVQMIDYLQNLSFELIKPRAILVLSAHWEAPVFTLTTSALPLLEYDYQGFPGAAYQIEYPCRGEPQLALQAAAALRKSGIEAALDGTRGLDHGAFVPLKIMYPAADIPVVQLSLQRGLNAADHLAMGRALQALDYDGLLVLGSGFSFHNLREFFNPDPIVDQKIREFKDWLKTLCLNPQLNASERNQMLGFWHKAPHARFCHPREEHLLPLLSCAALAGRAADHYNEVKTLNKMAAMLQWS